MVAVQSDATSVEVQFESLLKQYPALATAHQFIRSTRSPHYFDMSIQIFQRWIKPLSLEWIPETIIFTNLMASLDTLFEACQTSRELQFVTDELNSITRLNTAMLYLI